MKYLRTFEQYSPVGVDKVNEEFFWKGKEGKSAKKFYADNADLMKQLKEAEKEGGDKLKEIQDQLMGIVKDDWEEIGQGLSGEEKGLLRKDLETEILNVDAGEDDRSTLQKIASGASAGKTKGSGYGGTKNN